MATQSRNSSEQTWTQCFMKGAQDIRMGLQHQVCLALATIGIALIGATARGDWILILVHFIKAFGGKGENETSYTCSVEGLSYFDIGGINDTLEQYYLQNAHIIVTLAVAVSFISYYSLAGWLQWTYYIKRKDKPEEWKCQPEKFLSREDEAHEILLGSLNMLLGGTLSGLLATYVVNGGPCKVYFSLMELGFPYVIVSLIVLFLWEEAIAYYIHSAGHTPFLYKHIHKMHHRYHQPTAFSTTALHPFEFLTFQILYMVPIFVIPVYSGAFILSILYIYYYGMIDHSGIMLDAVWPWQPPTIFHDDHHRYFHVNFGFNSYFFDWLHGTLRKEDREYSEEIFGGKGKKKQKSVSFAEKVMKDA